ncbi:MAG: hypothetical protein K8U57_29370 [Planctomycetes bacterium]|nr:hypothetical protein [Planctomycetota bacterium]
MSDKRVLGAFMGIATARKPRAVLVGKVGCASVSDQLRKLDWDVLNVPTSDDLACAVIARKPSVVVLPVGLDGESGYLVAAKLRATKRKLKVVLVGATRTPEAERFAKFVGAAFVAETDGAGKLVNAVVA